MLEDGFTILDEGLPISLAKFPIPGNGIPCLAKVFPNLEEVSPRLDGGCPKRELIFAILGVGFPAWRKFCPSWRTVLPVLANSFPTLATSSPIPEVAFPIRNELFSNMGKCLALPCFCIESTAPAPDGSRSRQSFDGLTAGGLAAFNRDKLPAWKEI